MLPNRARRRRRHCFSRVPHARGPRRPSHYRPHIKRTSIHGLGLDGAGAGTLGGWAKGVEEGRRRVRERFESARQREGPSVPPSALRHALNWQRGVVPRVHSVLTWRAGAAGDGGHGGRGGREAVRDARRRGATARTGRGARGGRMGVLFAYVCAVHAGGGVQRVSGLKTRALGRREGSGMCRAAGVFSLSPSARSRSGRSRSILSRSARPSHHPWAVPSPHPRAPASDAAGPLLVGLSAGQWRSAPPPVPHLRGGERAR